MRRSISEKTRQLVAERANYLCEYCRIHNDDMFLSFEVDHIISLKHGGTNDIENLAFACPHCNQHKGTDFATISGGEIVRLFDPRNDIWSDHFDVINSEIISKTKVGAASIKVLRFNEPDLLILRQILIEAGRYL